MATRSMIAMMHGNSAKAVYCHWDGYLGNNGRILQTHYDSVKTLQLISMGDLSSLQAEIGEAHPFSRLECNLNSEEWQAKYGNQCTFYGRDRNETGTGYRTFQSLAELIDGAEGRGCEFVYILKGEEWFYSERRYEEGWSELQFLAPALEDLVVA